MAIRYEPSKILKKLPESKIKGMVSAKLSLNRAALSTLADTGILSKRKLTEVALRVIKQYKERFETEKESGLSVQVAKEEALGDKELLVNRVQNTAVHEVAKDIKQGYRGEYYQWLPSDADEPDPLHQLNYGGKFQIGKGEMPGDRYGCRCGMNILVPGTQLEI